jgi:hypothetical protein
MELPKEETASIASASTANAQQDDLTQRLAKLRQM